MLYKRNLIILVCIFALGAFLRFLRIHEFPLGLHPKEAFAGNLAFDALAKGAIQPWYPDLRAGWIFVALETLSVWIFGNTALSLRLIPALFGTLTLAGLYLALRELFPETKIKAGFLTPAHISLFLLAGSYWHMQYSRLAFPEILVPFFFLFGIYFLLKGLKHGTILDCTAAGIFIGFGFYTTPLFWILSLFFLAPMTVALKNYMRGMEKFCIPCALALTLFTVCVTTIPLILAFVWNVYYVFWGLPLNNLLLIAQTLFQTAFTFTFIFNAGDAILRNMTALLPLVAGFLGLWISRIVSNLLNWFEKQKKTFPRRTRQMIRIQRYIILLTCASLVLIPLKTYHAYFFRWAQHPNTHFTQTTDLLHLGEYLAALPAETTKYIVVNGDAQNAHVVRFAAQKQKNMRYVPEEEINTVNPDKNAIISFLDGSDRALIGFFRKKFPELSAKAPGDFVILSKNK